MTTEPLLSSYSDEKPPIDYTPDFQDERNDMIIDDKEFDGLRVGQPTLRSRVADRWASTSNKKKALVGVLLLLAAATTFGRLHHSHSHRGFHDHDHPHKDLSKEFEDWVPTNDLFVPRHVESTVAAEYATALSASEGVWVANATFDLSSVHRQHAKHFKYHDRKRIMVDVAPGPDVRMIISKGDIVRSQLIVESSWTGEQPSVEMASAKKVSALSIGDEDASHTIHLVLPREAQRVPKLNIRAPYGIPIEFHSSVLHSGEPLEFKGLTIASEGDISVPDNMLVKTARLHTTEGDITGSYNVSKAIVFKTITGNIKTSVWVRPPPPPPHGHRHGRPPPPPPPHGPHGPHGPLPPPPSPPPHGDSHREDEEGEQDEEHEAPIRRSFFKGETKEHKKHTKHGKHDHDHKPPHPPHGPPRPPHHPPHGHPPPPPPPPFIGAFSINGSIALNVLSEKPHNPFLGVLVKSFTDSGDVSVHISEFFKGFFKADAFHGELDISAKGNKTVEYLKEVVLEDGHLIEGLILPNGTHGPHGPKRPHHPPKNYEENEEEEDEEEEDEERNEEEEDFEKRSLGGLGISEISEYAAEVYGSFVSNNEGESKNDEDERPPHDGPGGPPRGPPHHDGPGGPPPPHGPPHKGPEGPRPPHGPHGPHDPHDPHGPHGPHDPHGPHPPPPPPGFGKVFAGSGKGDVKLRL